MTFPATVEELTEEQLVALYPDRKYDTLASLLCRTRGEVLFNGQPISQESYDRIRKGN